MATKNDEQIVLGLDIQKTAKQINADIKKLQSRLEKVRISGTLDAKSTAKEINAQIKALKSQLKAVNLKANIDEADAKKTGKKIGQIISDSAQKAIDRAGISIDKLDYGTADAAGLKDVSDSLQSVADSAEKADKQVSSASDSMASKLKLLKEIGLGIVKNIFPEKDIKTILGLVDSLKSGTYSNISFDSIKNIGKLRMSVRN